MGYTTGTVDCANCKELKDSKKLISELRDQLHKVSLGGSESEVAECKKRIEDLCHQLQTQTNKAEFKTKLAHDLGMENEMLKSNMGDSERAIQAERDAVVKLRHQNDVLINILDLYNTLLLHQNKRDDQTDAFMYMVQGMKGINNATVDTKTD